MRRILPRIAIATAVVLAATALGGWTAPGNGGGHDRSGGAVTIYLTRHGQTILNTLERVQGWTDSPLVDAAARALPVGVGANLRAREGAFDAAYSADMKRHYETATLILRGAKQKLPVTQDAGLREINFGRYEGAENQEMWTAIVERLGYPVDPAVSNPQAPGGWQYEQALAAKEKGLDAMMSAMKALATEPTHSGQTLPAEDCADVDARMAASLDRIAVSATRHHQKRVLVVSSGLSISCFLQDSLGYPVNGGLSNVAVSKLRYADGRWTVLSANDKSYYPAP